MIKKNVVDQVFFEEKAIEKLRFYISEWKIAKKQVVVLVDSNTRQYCAPYLYSFFVEADYRYSEIVIQAGECSKNIETLTQIWTSLTEFQADRFTVFINLGGGVVSDVGGFAASSFKRGITFINIPTTLLSMIDAAIGGKTGIDFLGNKNLIGSFSLPDSVLIFKSFLETLPEKEIRAAVGEMLKYAFVVAPDMFSIFEKNIDLQKLFSFIEPCVYIKQQLVENDMFDHGKRKVLNFGHTVAHAFEALALDNNHTLRHGEAVAFGILVSLWLSEKYCGLDAVYSSQYELFLKHFFVPFKFDISQVENLIVRIKNDKKNATNEYHFVLLEAPGSPKIDIAISEDDLRNSLIRFCLYSQKIV